MLVILFTILATTVQIVLRENFKRQATMRDVTLVALNAYRSTIKPPLCSGYIHTTSAVSPQIFRVPPLPRK
uniref:Putative secreted protein n=1 Tax=Ixodes ricinus TaxID=34613 RepID=A0A6B0TRY3_IXORI